MYSAVWCASIHAEDFFVNDCCNWEAVEHVRERFPQFDVVTTLACNSIIHSHQNNVDAVNSEGMASTVRTFIVEAVNSVN